MSDPPTTSSDPTHHHHHQHHHHHHNPQQQQQILHLPTQVHNISRSTTMNIAAAATSSSIREYRKGNWTLQETMILISAKKQDDERRSKANLTPSSSSSSDPTVRKAVGGELRWKWVENYCWSHGCQRSQNQCNDKWDNLLRDYKKIREFQSREEDHESSFSSSSSYWKMEKHERKDKNLPSNMPFEVFQALNDVVQRKYLHRTPPPPPPPPPPGLPPSPVVPMLPPPPETTPTATTSPAVSESSSGTESSEKQNTESKRRKVRDVNSSIERSTSMLAHTLRSCEEKREIRHQQLMELQRRSLQIEESRNQLHRQGIADLVTAVAGLSAGINNNNMSRSSREGEGYGCLYSGEEVRVLKEQNEAMQAEMITIKNELSQLRDQMPNLMQNMMHNMIHTMQNPPNSSTSLSQPHHHSMDPSGPGGDA